MDIGRAGETVDPKEREGGGDTLDLQGDRKSRRDSLPPGREEEHEREELGEVP